MLSAYQLDQAQRNLSGYAIFGVNPPLGVRTLGAITPEQAWINAAQGETGSDIVNWRGIPHPEVPTGNISAGGWSPSCATMPAPNVNLFQTASGLALGTTAAGVGIASATGLLPAAAIPVVGGIIAGVGVVVGIISTILNHHTAAVRQEQELGCAAIAAFNNAMSVIDQAAQSGQMRPQDAIAGLDALLSKVSAFVAPAVKHNPCNANCELLVEMRAMVNYRKSVYADLASGALQVQSGSASVPAQQISSGSVMVLPGAGKPAVAPQSGAGGWLMIAALVAGGFALARFA